MRDFYKPITPPPEAIHKEISNGECRVIIAPTRWRKSGTSYKVTEGCAYCTTCGWDTPLMFSLVAIEAVARKHLGMVVSTNSKPSKEGMK